MRKNSETQIMTMQDAYQFLRSCGLDVRLDAGDGATVVFRLAEECNGIATAEMCILDRVSGTDQWIALFPGPGQRQFELNGSLEELVDVMCQIRQRLVSNPQITLREAFPEIVKNASFSMS